MENKEIKQNRYGIEYTKQGDYYMPNLVLEKEKLELNKYGRARLNYLKTNKKAEYMIMFTKGTLNKHLKEVQETAEKRLDFMIDELVKKENITEELKEKNQLAWVSAMNSIKSIAEEIIYSELIYVWVQTKNIDLASNVFVLTPQIQIRMGQVPNPNTKNRKRDEFMRSRNIKVNIFLNEEENKILNEKVKKSGLNKSEFFRKIILDYQLKEKPDEKFYEILSQLRGMATNLNQMSRVYNQYKGYVNENKYVTLYNQIQNFILALEEVYLIPQKSKNVSGW